MNREPTAPFGPIYPALGATIAKMRKVANPTADQRRAHGDAVAAAIRALQARELRRELPTFKPSCASGTWHNNGDGSVGRAVREQQARALATCPDKIRAARTPHQWQLMYDDAMAAKRAQCSDPFLTLVSSAA